VQMMQKTTERKPFSKRLVSVSTGVMIAGAIVVALTYLDPSHSYVTLAWSLLAAVVFWWIVVRVVNSVRK
jgi:hypothetical protein